MGIKTSPRASKDKKNINNDITMSKNTCKSMNTVPDTSETLFCNS